MAKINQAHEKVLRNELYALKFKKEEEKPVHGKVKKKEDAKYAHWCRTLGHLPSCRALDCKPS